MSHDYGSLLWDESADIAKLLHELDGAAFDQPSLCEGWRVRDVISHMLVGHTTPMPAMIAMLARHRFDVPQGSRVASVDFGTSHSPAELRAAWDEVVDGRVMKGISRVIPKKEAFVDHLIHHQDIRRPLGQPRSIPTDRLTAALDAMPTIGGFVKSKGRMAGLSWKATDVDWSFGSGPEVTGPGEAIVMVSSGRSAPLDELSGDGVAMLRGRLAA